jgi:hypothetical protein
MSEENVCVYKESISSFIVKFILLLITFVLLGILLSFPVFLYIFLALGIFVLYIHYKATSLIITRTSVLIERFVCNTEIPFTQINTIETQIFGSIIIRAGNDMTGIIFNHLTNPEEVKEMILERVHQVTRVTKTESPHQTGNQTISDDLSAIEKLAEFHEKGILTDEEFSKKKAMILGIGV